MNDVEVFEMESGSVRVRKCFRFVETVVSDGLHPVRYPVRHVAVGAVVENPYAAKYDESLQILQDLGGEFGTWAIAEAMSLLPRGIKAYGKAGVVGENGELEHVAAVLHPQFGGPTRSESGGISILPSVKKRGAMGCNIDIPVHHITAMKVRDYFDSISICIPDAPAANELLVVLAVTDGPRPHARMGGLKEADIVGEDGVH